MPVDRTNGSVIKNIMLYVLPYFFSYFLQTLYGMADLYIIGQFNSTVEITAVSIGSQIMHMVTVMIVGLAMGTTVIVGQSLGAKDNRKISAVTGNSFNLFLILSFVAVAVLFVLTDSIVGLFSTPMEAKGAALGTVVSQIFSVLLPLYFIKKSWKNVTPARENYRLRKNVFVPLVKIGTPVALKDGFIQIAFIVITVIVNRRGLVDAAAVGSVGKIICFIFLVPLSMLSAVSALAVQNLGAGKSGSSIICFAAFLVLRGNLWRYRFLEQQSLLTLKKQKDILPKEEYRFKKSI